MPYSLASAWPLCEDIGPTYHIALLLENDRAVATGNMHREFVKFGQGVSEISVETGNCRPLVSD